MDIKSPGSAAASQALPKVNCKTKFFKCGNEVTRTSTFLALAALLLRRHSPARAAKAFFRCGSEVIMKFISKSFATLMLRKHSRARAVKELRNKLLQVWQ